ncbi:MAG TPA: hypothetical protein VGC09_12385 [Rhodopila sp.]
MTKINDLSLIRCPSAQPSADGLVIGVVAGTAEARRIGYLTEPQPVTQEILALAGPVAPAQVFRMAAPCMGEGCKHFAGGDCHLVKRIVAALDPVVSGLPPCQIRPTCRWFRQEGRAACVRCPQVVTNTYDATELQRRVADPDSDGPDPS